LCFGVHAGAFFGFALGFLVAGEAPFWLALQMIFFFVEEVGRSTVATYVCAINE
jgi:hypothetical protein